MNDDLGKRMKECYEDRTRFMVPRRTYTIIRLDGKAFHTFTRSYIRPFDTDLMTMMDNAAIALCKSIQGVCVAYVQSDEISLVITDFATLQTDMWFDGNIQKMVSISASIATAAFNHELLKQSLKNGNEHTLVKLKNDEFKFAQFDSRVFTIPSRIEVMNYLIWRQLDATRNSIQMVAQSLYSQKELHGKNTNILQEMIFQKGINWNDYKTGEKRGRLIVKESVTVDAKDHVGKEVTAIRTHWVSYAGITDKTETPKFTQDKDLLNKLIPRLD